MQINSKPDDVIHETIEKSTGAALAIQQSRELPICVVHSVRNHVQANSEQIQAEIAVIIEVTGDNSEGATEQCHSGGADIALREPLRQLKADLAIKMTIDEGFDFARLVSCFDGGRRDFNMFRHDYDPRELRHSATAPA